MDKTLLTDSTCSFLTPNHQRHLPPTRAQAPHTPRHSEGEGAHRTPGSSHAQAKVKAHIGSTGNELADAGANGVVRGTHTPTLHYTEGSQSPKGGMFTWPRTKIRGAWGKKTSPYMGFYLDAKSLSRRALGLDEPRSVKQAAMLELAAENGVVFAEYTE